MKGEILKQNTINQLKNCGKVGLYRFNDVIHLSPQQARGIVEKNEILYLNRHEMYQYGVNRLVFKRDEIRSEKHSLPYCARFEYFYGEEFITIQEIYPDDVKCKLIGSKEAISKIKENVMIHGNMNDAEFFAANGDIIRENRFISGYLNRPKDEVDINGIHITKIEDYDNYLYDIYGSESRLFRLYEQEKQKNYEEARKTRTLVYLKNKSERYQSQIKNGGRISAIKRTIRKNPDFVKEVSSYKWDETDLLIRVMGGICKRHMIGLPRGWQVWKTIMVREMEKEIHKLQDELGEYPTNNIKINI